MSRTKRIYNSYKKYGRFYPKKQSYCNPLPPFDLKMERTDDIHNRWSFGAPKIEPPEKTFIFDVNSIIIVGGYYRRWHPYLNLCKGNCNYCKNRRGYSRWKQAKHTRKLKELKFNFFNGD